MHPRARRAISVALSMALHALLLLELWTWTLVQPGLPEQRVLPVKIIEPRPVAPAPKAPRPAPPPVPPQPPPPAPVAKAPEPPPEAQPPPPQPEKKIPLPESQVVSPSDAGKNEVPPDTRLLSDRDTKVEEQMVHRGQPKPGDESIPENKAAKAAPPPKQAKPQRGHGGDSGREPPPQVAALPGLDRLMPNALRLAQEGYGQPVEEAQPSDQQPPKRDANGGGLWLPADGPVGSLDYLPDVREGDITMLNTKAEVFAPFVRRVALRVFQNFWISLKRELGSNTTTATETVEAEAVMSARGDLLRFTVKQRSARISLGSDRRLQQACNDGFFDRNPPPGARAADGNIHFILRTNVEVGASPRGWTGFVEFMAGLL